MLTAALALAVTPLLAAAGGVQCVGSRATLGAQFCRLEPAGSGVRATVCREQEPPQAYRWTNDRWIRDVAGRPPLGAKPPREMARSRCAALVPEQTISMKEAVRLRPHLRFGPDLDLGIGGCVETEDAVFFGISFYEGEGMDGVGGIGRYDRRTRKVVVRRPQFLLDKSIDEMVIAGDAIWLTIYQHYEGDDVPHGVARYDWIADRLQLMEGSEAGPCGFDVSQLTVAGGRLWMRTELDVASLDLATGRWHHVVPSAAGPVASSCRWLDQRIIDATHAEPCMSNRTGETVLEYMAAFRPAEFAELISARPAVTWSTWEATAMARTAKSFEDLDRVVLRPLGFSRNPPSLIRRRGGAWITLPREEQHRVDMLNAIIGSWGERRSTEPAWRDYLLRASAPYYLRWFRGDSRVTCALISLLADDSSVADYLVDVAGPRAVPLLMAALPDQADPAASYDSRRARVIGALERATHQMLPATGDPYLLPADSDTPGYDIDTPEVDKKHSAALGWGVRREAERQQIILRWRTWWESHRNDPAFRPPACPGAPAK